jgi:hypothetical protein
VATGSGLDAQVMYKAETTWGTAVTVDKAVEFIGESLKFDPTWLEPTGLRPGTKYKRVSRVRQSRKSVSGDITLEHATLNMGTLWKHALASGSGSTPVLISGTAYKQIHTPGDFRGFGLTVQVGRPEPSSGTVRPFTFAGCKVSGWEFSLTDNAIPTLKLTIDGRSEATATALATASFAAGSTVFDFSQATLKLGGTATTASGETSIASGVTVATIVKSFTLTGSAPMDANRFGLGNAGLKAEQLENATPTITGKLDAEFSKTELYDVFQANTTIALQLDLTGAVISGGNSYLLSFILPAIKLKAAAPAVGGPDVVQMSTDFEAYSDETNPVIQTKIVSTESSL